MEGSDTCAWMDGYTDVKNNIFTTIPRTECNAFFFIVNAILDCYSAYKYKEIIEMIIFAA